MGEKDSLLPTTPQPSDGGTVSEEDSDTMGPALQGTRRTKKSDDDDVLIPAMPEPSHRGRNNYRTSDKNLDLLFSGFS